MENAHAALTELRQRVAQVRAANDTQQLESLRADIAAFQTEVASLRREVDADPGPRVGDVVCGTQVVSWGDVTESFQLDGKITNVESGKVSIQFERCSALRGPNWKFRRGAQRKLMGEVETPKGALQWSEVAEQWELDL